MILVTLEHMYADSCKCINETHLIDPIAFFHTNRYRHLRNTLLRSTCTERAVYLKDRKKKKKDIERNCNF